MKQVLLVLALVMLMTTSFARKHKRDKALVVVVGRFAFCGASPAKPTGKVITVEGKKFFEGVSVCPVLDGPSVANTILVPNPSVSPDGTEKTVWSYFWYCDSVPQAPTWKNLPTENRTFIIAKGPEGGMSNMWCMPCNILPEKVNGVTIAECYGPLNELAFPMKKALRARKGQTSVTQAPMGATYPVGTIIPNSNTK